MADSARAERLAAAVREAAHRALARGHWDEALSLANDLLADDPDDHVAAQIAVKAESRGSAGATEQGRRYLTVLFSDVVGSTALSERLDPEDYLTIISAYRNVVRDAVESHNGHIDQFQGDGVVAYFGYPSANEDDQVRAIEAGLEIVAGVGDARHGIDATLAARVGIHVGRTVMTSAGARDQSAAIGFAANVAARIQGVARPGTVVVSESVAETAADCFELVPVGSPELRGVSDEVEVFEVSAPRARSTLGDKRLATPLVGREHERALIESAWDAAQGDGDHDRLVVVVGEPGIGKSRLVRHSTDLARADGANLIEINCGRDLRHVGLGAVRRGIERALGLSAAATRGEGRTMLEARGAVVGLTPGTVAVLDALLGESAPAVGATDLTPDRLREAIIAALLEWITAEAALAPTLLVVEDLHWADDTAVETIRRLTARPLPPGLLVLVTARAGELPGPLRGLSDAAVELLPLSPRDTAEMVRAFAVAGALDADAIDALAARSEGVPLFTEHLVMAATASGGGPVSGDLPVTLEGLLQARLDATGAGRGVAEVAAVIGREFSVDLVEKALARLGARAPISADGARAALRLLERTGLVESDGAGRMRFRHTLVRDVAYEMQLRSDRPPRHDAVASALDATRGANAPAATLAYHHEQAGNLEPAAAAHLRAAEQASGLAEWEVALGHLRSVAELADQVEGPGGHRLELAACMQVGAVSAASFSYARAEAADAYRRAMELCDLLAREEGHDAGLDVQLVAALGGLWSNEVVSGDLPAARRVTDRLEHLLEGPSSELSPEIWRFTLGCRGFERLYGGDTFGAVATLRDASRRGHVGPIPVSLGTPHDYVAATDALLAVALTLTGDDAGADEALARGLARTQELAFPVGPFSEAVVQVYAAYLHRLRGDAPAAREAAEAVQSIGERHGFQEHSMLGQMLLLAASVMEGDAPATQALESTLSLWRMAGGGLAVPVLLAELAAGCLVIDDVDRAGAALDEATSMMAITEQRGSESEVLRLRAAIEQRAGASEEAVVKGLIAAADLALDQGATRLAGRALRDIGTLTDGRVPAAAVEVATRLVAAVPESAAGDLREVEGWLSAQV